MTKKRGWIIATVIQVLFLLFIAASYYSIDYFGKDITIKTVPVDPRDILYGDYVTLNFEISTVPLSKWAGDTSALDRGQQRAYVVLEENNEGYYEVKEVNPNKTNITEKQVLLHAKAEKVWSDTSDQMRLTYGFERYYVQENTGKELEQQASNMDAVIRVAPWGAHKIVTLSP